MKRKYVMGVILLTILQLTGCSNISSQNNSNEQNKVVSTTTAEINVLSENKTVGNETSYDIQGKDILKVTTTCLDTAIGTSLDSLAKNSTEIISGLTKNVTFVSIQGQAWTKVDIEITETLSGNLNKGDLISIYWLGGYIPLSEHIKYYKDEHRFSSLDKNQIENTMIQSIVENETFPAIGDNNLYFLVETPSNSPLPKGAYERIAGKSAELNISSDGNTLSRSKNEVNSLNENEEFKINEVKKIVNNQ